VAGRWSMACDSARTIPGDHLSWVNMILGSLWPKADKAFSSFIHEDLTPQLRQVLPSPFRRLKFSRFTLGKNTPEFGPIEVSRHSETHVQVELDVRYFSDVDMLLDAGTGGITIGISHLTFVGRLCLALKPLVETWPVVGGLHISFANQPRVELKFRGLAVVAEFPGFAEKVQDVVDEYFRERFVLPNCRSYWYTRDQRIVNLAQDATQPPLGVLRVRLIQAQNLAGANWTMGSVDKFSSDPYALMRLGNSSHRTSTVNKSTDPVWPQNEPSAYFVVYHREQSLEISFYSQDTGLIRKNFVGYLGRMPPICVRAMLGDWPLAQQSGERRIRKGQMTLDTSKVNRTMLHVNDPINQGVPSRIELEVEWFDLVPSPQPFGLGTNAPVAVVLVELHTGTGFPEEAAFSKQGLRWRCRLENQQPAVSRKGLYQDDSDVNLNIHPRLFSVIDRLLERNLPVPDISDIVDVEQEDVTQYIQFKHEQQQRRLDRQRVEDELCIDLHWHQSLTLLGRKPEESSVVVELLSGDDSVPGRLDAIPLHYILQKKDCTLSKKKMALMPPDSDSGRPGGLSAWLFPSCHKPTLARGRWQHVQMEVSVRMQHMVFGDSPRGIGDASSEATTALDSAALAASSGASSYSNLSELPLPLPHLNGNATGFALRPEVPLPPPRDYTLGI